MVGFPLCARRRFPAATLFLPFSREPCPNVSSFSSQYVSWTPRQVPVTPCGTFFHDLRPKPNALLSRDRSAGRFYIKRFLFSPCHVFRVDKGRSFSSLPKRLTARSSTCFFRSFPSSGTPPRGDRGRSAFTPSEGPHFTFSFPCFTDPLFSMAGFYGFSQEPSALPRRLLRCVLFFLPFIVPPMSALLPFRPQEALPLPTGRSDERYWLFLLSSFLCARSFFASRSSYML